MNCAKKALFACRWLKSPYFRKDKLPDISLESILAKNANYETKNKRLLIFSNLLCIAINHNEKVNQKLNHDYQMELINNKPNSKNKFLNLKFNH